MTCHSTERLPRLLLILNLSPAEFALALDIPLRRARRVLKTTRKPSLSLMARVGRAFPQLSADWLLSGEGEVLRPTSNYIGVNHGTCTQIICTGSTNCPLFSAHGSYPSAA